MARGSEPWDLATVRTFMRDYWGEEDAAEMDAALAAHDAQVRAEALREAASYARPDGGDHVGMSRSEAQAFEDALLLVEEYADRIEKGGDA